MKSNCAWGIAMVLSLAGILVTSAPTEGQAEQPLLHHTFEDGMSGWMPMGTTAKLSITNDLAYIKESKHALQFNYGINKGEINLAMTTIEPGTLALGRSLSYWVRTDFATTILTALQEKDGGRYLSFSNCPKDRSQKIELNAKDFVLSQEPGDPVDPNGKLDMDQVTAIGIGDLGQLFIQIDKPEINQFFNIQPGNHVMYIDDLLVSRTAFAETALPAGQIWLDSLVHPQVSWIAIGNPNVSAVQPDLKGPHMLQLVYHLSKGKPMGIMKNVPREHLKDIKQVTFKVATDKATTLFVQLETRDGNKFNAPLSLDAGLDKPRDITLKYGDFTVGQDSKDPNASLDMSKVKTMMLVDISSMQEDKTVDNTLRVWDLKAAK